MGHELVTNDLLSGFGNGFILFNIHGSQFRGTIRSARRHGNLVVCELSSVQQLVSQNWVSVEPFNYEAELSCCETTVKAVSRAVTEIVFVVSPSTGKQLATIYPQQPIPLENC